MLLFSLLPVLVGALSVTGAIAHSADRLPARRAPHRQDVSHELAQKRAFSFNAPHYSLYLYGGLLVLQH